MAADEQSKSRSEHRINQKWDRCIENVLVKAGYGFVGAGLASLLLLRSKGLRQFTTGLGTGIGIGNGYFECRAHFENPNIKLAQFHFVFPDFSKLRNSIGAGNNNGSAAASAYSSNSTALESPPAPEQQPPAELGSVKQ